MLMICILYIYIYTYVKYMLHKYVCAYSLIFVINNKIYILSLFLSLLEIIIEGILYVNMSLQEKRCESFASVNVRLFFSANFDQC